MQWVFAYGSLRPGGSAHELVAAVTAEVQRAELGGHGLWGRTWPYPFVASAVGEVVGEAIRITDPDPVLARLDRYEGPDYRRMTLPVSTPIGTIPAVVWVAASHVVLPDDERIPSGDWFDR